jgi:hypothetical protein
MSKIISDSGKEYTAHDVSRNAFTLTDESGNKSVYAFEDQGSAKEHINSVENGTQIDSGDFGKNK